MDYVRFLLSNRYMRRRAIRTIDYDRRFNTFNAQRNARMPSTSGDCFRRFGTYRSLGRLLCV